MFQLSTIGKHIDFNFSNCFVRINTLNLFSKKMTKKVGAKAIPIISSVLCVLIDTHQINKVIKLSNIINQKRFLIEKEMLNYTKPD